jgi:hypothetical protein
MEVVSQVFVAMRQTMVDQSQFDRIYGDAENIARKLSALKNTLQGNKDSG